MYTLATAIFSTEQDIMVALADVHYLAPYVGRMYAYCDSINETVNLLKVIRTQNLKTKIMLLLLKISINLIHFF